MRLGPRQKLLLRWNQASHKLRSVPILVLMPHSRCNCRCVMCDIWKANRQRREIDPDTLAVHLRDMQRLGVKWVVLSGGEALMHSNLWRFCQLLKSIGSRITLLSTGLLLERDAGKVVRHIDDVIVSLDGSEPTHDAIRNVPGAYARMDRGIRALKLLDPDYRISARCVLQRDNFHDFPNIVRAARSLSLDGISFLAADVLTEAYNRPGGWDGTRRAAVALTLAQADELEKLIDGAARNLGQEFDSGFIRESPAKLRSIVRYYRALQGSGVFPETRCNAPWVSAVMDTDGSLKPCYFHPAYGSLANRGMGELINSPQALSFRRNLDVKHNEICRKCTCTLTL